jgi:hypothetical protein
LIEQIGAESLQCLHHLLFPSLLSGVGELHDADITCNLVVDSGVAALAAGGIGADSAVVLPEGHSEGSLAGVAVGLFFEKFRASHLDLFITVEVHGRLRFFGCLGKGTANDFFSYGPMDPDDSVPSMRRLLLEGYRYLFIGSVLLAVEAFLDYIN